MNDQNYAKTRIPVDIAFDISMLAIIVPVLAANLILLVLSFHCPACEILITVVWYAGILALFLQDRTEVEFTHGIIIVHRHFLGPVVLNRKDIIRTFIRKNKLYAYRRFMYLLMLLSLGYLAYDAFYDILIQYQMRTIPAEVIINHTFSAFLILFLFLVLFFNIRTRLSLPFSLRVETNASKFIFYLDRPDEFERIITDSKMGTD
ncbi:hypothetical protein [Methanolobus chelungpuianus]|uniref:Uncharacterized protein n=1 Tax=Methanolobus chelungpuianus TaxID=502115 RepID=A0AAE3H960_9EURY|nr:hypothetical protein [Methanolobus chelungpuianus]MCQ6962417.1 hypothetical protein [Methanolobus chelungpuianus]